jgi:dCMP deaminase
MDWTDYYLNIANAVSLRSSCSRRQVGAVIVVDGAIVSTGYNGTPRGANNCNTGGCPRCSSGATPGSGYDLCLCVHAEQNSICQAAERGVATGEGVLYCTLRPCLGCVKLIIQAGIRTVVYSHQHEGAYDHETDNVYNTLIRQTGIKIAMTST